MQANSLLLAIAAGPAVDPVASLAEAWQQVGIQCETFLYEEKQSDDQLLDAFRSRQQELCREKACSPREVVLGGFSRGARLAARLARVDSASGLLGLGYPFHSRGAPQERHGLAQLQALRLPTLIVQGSRDAHGNRQEVRGYGPLPGCVSIHWLEDGNHRWQPRERSSTTADALLRSASTATIDFLRSSLLSGPHD